MRNQTSGVLLYGVSGPAQLPFLGGTLCIAPPFKRTTAQAAGGPAVPADCSGSYAFHFSDFYMFLQAFVPGQTLFGQYVTRDPHHPDGTGTGLSDALEFTLRP